MLNRGGGVPVSTSASQVPSRSAPVVRFGVMLVAPVTIGAGATIGAGSTITRDAPAGQLSLERSPQRTIEHWQRPGKK